MLIVINNQETCPQTCPLRPPLNQWRGKQQAGNWQAGKKQ